MVMWSGRSAQMTPEFRVLSEDQLHDIHEASMEILLRTGVRIHSGEAVQLLRQAGAFVEDDDLVKIPGQLIDWAVGVAPSNIPVFDRNGEPAMQLGRRRTYFGTGSDTVSVSDPHSGDRRPPLLADVADFARLCDALKHIDFVMCMGIASDVGPETAELRHFHAMVSNTVKPIVYTATTLDMAERTLDMAEAVAGGAEGFRQRPFAIMYIEPISPLVFTGESMEKLLYAAGKGIPSIFMSGMLHGASGPITVAGSLALANAESLAGVLIAQLKRAGAPVISGGGVLSFDMATTIACYGSPEFMLSAAAIAEIARHYGLPSWGYAGCSESKVFDEQAASDAAQWILMAALSGSNLVHDVGYLESGRTSSYDMLVFSDEMIGKTRHILEGIRVDADTLAVDVVESVGPGGSFLPEEHTLRNFRSAWFPTLEDRNRLEQWIERGSTNMRQRVNAKVRHLLETRRPAPLDPALDEQLRAVANEAA